MLGFVDTPYEPYVSPKPTIYTKRMYLGTLLNHKMHNTIPNIQERTEFSRPLKRCAELLHMDKSASLTEAKNLLEFVFFAGGQLAFETEFDAKLWLDERRASYLNQMVIPCCQDVRVKYLYRNEFYANFVFMQISPENRSLSLRTTT